MEIASPLPPLPPAQRRNKRSSEGMGPYSPSCAMETIEPSPASKRRRMFGDSTSSENQTLQQITQPFFSPLQPTHRTKKRSRLDEDETSHHSSVVSSPPPSCEEVSKLGRDLNEQTVESARLMSENKVLKRAVFAQHNQLSTLQSHLTSSKKEIETMKSEGNRLLDRVRRLEGENYALKAHIGQVDGGLNNGFGGMGGGRDVF